MGWIIFAFVVVVLALEILVGVLRGAKLSGIRLGYTLLGTLVATLLAKSLTVKIVLKIAAANGVEGDSITEMVSGFFSNTQYAGIGKAAAPHIAGLSLSILIPLIFIPLFLLLKLVGLFLYLITKAIINKATAKAETEDGEPIKVAAVSRVLGGVLGGFVGLLTCALVTMPLFNVVTTINNSGVKDTVFGLLETVGDSNTTAKQKSDTVVAVLTALAYGDAIPANAADSSEDATIAGIKISIIKNLFESTANSPAITLLKYTGFEAVSNAILNVSTTVTPEDIGAEGTKTESYNLPEALSEILEVIEPVSELVSAIVSEDGFKLDDLDKVTEFADKLKDSGFLDDADKLEILNACKDVVTETVYSQLGMNVSGSESKDYASIDEFKSDVEALVEMSKVIASIVEENGGNGSTTGGQGIVAGDISNIDVDTLLKDPDKIKSFISSTLNLTNGTEIIANLINSNVSKYTNGKLENVTSAAKLDEVGKETIVELADSLMKFTKYDENTVLTDELKQEIRDAIDEISSKGLLTKEDAETIKQEFGLNN